MDAQAIEDALNSYEEAIASFEDAIDQLFEEEVLSASSFPKDLQTFSEGKQRSQKSHEGQTIELSSLKNIIHSFFHLFTPKNTVLKTQPQTQNSNGESSILASKVIAKRRSLLKNFRNIKQPEPQNGEAQDVDEFESYAVSYHKRFKELDSRFQLQCSRLSGIASWANWQQNGLDSRGTPDLDMLGKLMIFSLTIGFLAATIPRLLLGGTLISSIFTGVQISSLWVLNRQSLTELRSRRWWRVSILSLAISVAFYYPLLPILSRWFVNQGSKAYGEAYILDKSLVNAEQNFQKAVHLNPNNIRAYLYLGNVYEDLNKLDLAEEAYRTAAAGSDRLSDGNTAAISNEANEALNNLARIYIISGKTDVAIGWLYTLQIRERAKEEDGMANDYLLFSISKNIGWAYLSQEEPNYVLAEKHLDQATQFLPKLFPQRFEDIWPEIQAIPYCFLAQALEKQGKLEEAKNNWKKFNEKIDQYEKGLVEGEVSNSRVEIFECLGKAQSAS